ncbi:mucin-associated surface protein [Trypanosoma cruzi cruzi]|uniref:Mucin-associated surface protein (MASP) n=1 Tax=Trypanosoma cruzi TaxID=5693 RepID=A0A2V2US86_TRYCR|nr:mucin-associated surface protein [Trypanosoma cruzi cruzi]PWU86920.1 Mucin-associated surface protein (MASP) [Trypanosoma cruzi]
MAMMMTGRVLLACALCVLWCGTSGGRCDDAGTGETLPGASSSVVGKGSQESSPIAQGGSLNSVLEPISAKETRAETDEGRPSREEEESSADEEEEEEEDEKEGILQPSSPPQSPKKDELEKVNESEPKPENQRQVEGGIQNQREEETVDDGEAIEIKQKKEGSGPQPNNHQTPVQEENTSSGEVQQPSQGKEQKTNVEEIPPRNPAGDRSSGEHNNNDGSSEKEEGKEGVEGHERDRAQEREEAAHVSGAPKVNSTDIQQEVQRTHAGETPTGMKQRAGEEKDDETEEEREEQKEQNQENPPAKQETITGANATNQINTTPGDSDGSTAVSHTTSPLLPLVVACAAAAVVAA